MQYYENRAKPISARLRMNWRLSKPVLADKVFKSSKLLISLIAATVGILLAYTSVVLIVANEAKTIKSIQEMYFSIH